MNIEFKQPPIIFGKEHLIFLILGLFTSIFLYFLLRKKEENYLIKLLFIFGIIMILMEIWKQFFTYKYVFNNKYNMWFFPWQLCSMPMYCSFIQFFLKKDKQNIFLIFISTYGLFASIIALLLPYDMLRSQILLFSHGFTYHIMMIYEAIISILILRKRNNYNFKSSFILFIIMAYIAELINIIGHLIFNDIHLEPNMFYISPFYPTTQPVLKTIAIKWGILVEVIIYLSVISLISYLLYRLFIYRKT